MCCARRPLNGIIFRRNPLNRFFQGLGILGLSLIVLLAVIGLASHTAIADAAPNHADQPINRQITVSGMGQVNAKPDEATITIGVQMTSPTLVEATKQADDAMTKVLDAIKQQGVDATEIQTSNYSVTPIQNYKEGAPSTITGYQVSNVVTVKVKKIENVGKVLDAGMGAGANYLGGVFFGVADPSPYEKDART